MAGICIQACLLAWLSSAWVFAGVIIVIALVGHGAPRRGWQFHALTINMVALLAIGFLLKLLLAPHEFASSQLFIRTQLAHEIARFCLCLQCLLLFDIGSRRLPPWFVGLGWTSVIFVSDLRVASDRMPFTILLYVLFGMATVAFCMTLRRAPRGSSRGRSWRTAFLTIAVFFASGSGLAVAYGLHRYERQLEAALAEFLGLKMANRSSVGFSGRGGLNDVSYSKHHSSDEVILRVHNADGPAYLRGKAFDLFASNVWRGSRVAHQIGPSPPPPDVTLLRPGDRLYRLRVGNARPENVIDVWPTTPHEEYLFAPMQTDYIAGAMQGVYLDQDGVPTSSESGSLLPYSCWLRGANARTVLSEEDRARLLQVPDNLDLRVRSLARRLAGQYSSSRRRMDAIEQYFHENFVYTFGIRVPSYEDPLSHFLFERQAAHCEYFATAACILLRLNGVPARYVTGYVASGFNSVGQYWQARRKDAHAWVEAYDEENQQWVIVEATPSEGVPRPETESGRPATIDAVREFLRRLSTNIQQRGLFASLGAALRHPLGRLLLGIVLVVVACVILWRWRGRRSLPFAIAARKKRPRHAELSRLEALLAELGFVRPPTEPLTQFIRRVGATAGGEPWFRPVADWYGLYVASRYQGREDESLEARLETAVQPLMTAVKDSRRRSSSSPIQEQP
ncbi:transglutaminase family protein [Maioricimonas rarisocia]|uniref:transglutaminase family protein n=1 Tax=Maioricimonas rarisocia TaxID=2528026 RepID=UPI0018D210CE|nr:transglutaminase domain-containing protein [Maioricimonas rarisocia]